MKDIGARRSAGMAGPLLFILLMLVSGLSVCYRLPVWVRYAVDVILIAWAAAAFLIRPQRKRLGFCLTLAAVCLIPFLFAWLWSLGVWVIRLEEPAYIARGSRNTLYMLVNALFVGAVFYLFGRRGAAYVLCGMALANGAVLAQAVAKEGVLTLAREYATLLLTWTGQTGTAVARLELHDIVFAWGAFVIYGLVSGKGRRGRERWGTLTAAFFFVLSLKRIAVAGVILACMAAVIWRRISGQRCFLWVMVVAGTAAALAWVDLVRSGALAQIAALLHINMMGRESTYAMYDAVYEFSPLYMGRGIRFVYEIRLAQRRVLLHAQRVRGTVYRAGVHRNGYMDADGDDPALFCKRAIRRPGGSVPRGRDGLSAGDLCDGQHAVSLSGEYGDLAADDE